ncbi:MAG: TlpA disulfide reductase family protein [Acidobacteriota bacterium]
MNVKRNMIFTMISVVLFCFLFMFLSPEKISGTELKEKGKDIKKEIDQDQKSPLQMGDIAKPLSGVWLRGNPVDLTKPDGKMINVIELWETGCSYCLEAIPVLNKMQKKYKNVRIIGVSEEPEEQVRDFLKDTNLEYSILCADKNVIESYFGVDYGVPQVLIIDKKGIISWSGHPKHRFESVLKKIIKGTYDIKNEQKILKKENELNGLFQQISDEKNILKKVEELISLDPLFFDYYIYKLEMLEKMDDPDKLMKFHNKIYDAFEDSFLDLANFAEVLLTRRFEFVNIDIAERSIKRAVELSEGKNAKVLFVNARFFFMLGLVDNGLAVLKEAMQLDSSYYEELVYTYDFYEKVKTARDKLINSK